MLNSNTTCLNSLHTATCLSQPLSFFPPVIQIYLELRYLRHSAPINMLTTMNIVASLLLMPISNLAAALPAKSLERRADDSAIVSLCIDFGGTGVNCKDIMLGPDAFDNISDVFGTVFEPDQGAVNAFLGGAPSSATLKTEGISCTFGSQTVTNFLAFDTGVNCGGDTIQIDSKSGQLDFPGALNDNLACIHCDIVG
ncbi:hypothetical protein BT63DRAFT_255110 [Microthyrium microscopicum]|uniref:Uncharacterized protein n=1 Tax=Microthyrium microscopicum TaxID=703497 RepID=A0A6A6UCA8_9PEZI|nr:hypothetical protein BT63DRAFT_255110 [Microthyrium microscopicum]